jgi:hypothetical protein
MKILDTDQDGNLFDANSRRVRYRVDDRGNVFEEYEEMTEYGVIVADNLFDMYRDRAEDARERIRQGKTSPLEYFMHQANIEIELVIALTGYSRRQVKKHMKPAVYKTLGDDVLQRYAQAFLIDIDTIKNYKV